jgi:hypothetical protein
LEQAAFARVGEQSLKGLFHLAIVVLVDLQTTDDLIGVCVVDDKRSMRKWTSIAPL